MINNLPVLYVYNNNLGGYSDAARLDIYKLLKNNKKVYTFTYNDLSDATKYSKLQSEIEKNTINLNIDNGRFKIDCCEVILHVFPTKAYTILQIIKTLVKKIYKVTLRFPLDIEIVDDNIINCLNDTYINVISVPSNWNKNVLIKSGCTTNIIVEHEPLELYQYNYEHINIIDICKSGKIFSPYQSDNIENILKFRTKFLSIIEISDRKNISGLLTAYLNGFEYNDNVILIIKTNHNKIKFVENELQYIHTLINIYDLSNKPFPPLIVISDFLTDDEINNLYDQSDIYVNPSCGEGYSLPVYTATLKNMKIVSPLHGGILDYASSYENLYDVEYLSYKYYIKPITSDLILKMHYAIEDTLNQQIYIQQVDTNYNILPYKNTRNKKYINVTYTNAQNNINNSNQLPVIINNNFSLNIFNSEFVNIHNKVTILFELNVISTIKIFNYNRTLNPGRYIANIYIKNNINYNLPLFNIISDNNNINNIGLIINIICTDYYNNIYYINTDRNNSENIIYTGIYGNSLVSYKYFIPLKLNKDYQKKINLNNQIIFKCHKDGWKYVLNGLANLHTDDGIILDGFVDANFRWNKAYNKQIPYKSNWIGIMHNSPNMPAWYSDDNSYPHSIVLDNAFIESLPYCKGLFTLSKYLADFLNYYINDLHLSSTPIPIENLYYPTKIPNYKFNLTKYLENSNKQLINIGTWMRRFWSFYKIEAPGFQKVRLLPNNKSIQSITHIENIEKHIYNIKLTRNEYKSVTNKYYIPNEEYEKLLENNIVFLDLYDSSATTTIVECIASNTPLIINKLPAIIEYLGTDYPLYFSDISEIPSIINNFDLIKSAHLHLKNIEHKININTFMDDFTNSNIYKSL